MPIYRLFPASARIKIRLPSLRLLISPHPVESIGAITRIREGFGRILGYIVQPSARIRAPGKSGKPRERARQSCTSPSSAFVVADNVHDLEA